MSAIIQRIAGGGGAVVPGLPQKGSGDGFVVKFDTTTRVVITAGVYEVDGILFNLDADTTLNLSLTSAVGIFFHYIYLDKSASAPDTPVFFNELTESVEDTVKNGEYHPTNTEDRLVGVVEKVSNSATIRYFDTQIMSNGLIRSISSRRELDISKTPNGAWQDMGAFRLVSDRTPVNAIEAHIHMENSIASGLSAVSWRLFEAAANEPAISNSNNYTLADEFVSANSWGPLGASREIKAGGIGGTNAMSSWIMGYGYTR